MKTFIISMDTPLGRKRYGNISAQCASEGIDFEHVQGIHGKNLESEAVFEFATPMCAALCTPGMIGCGATHIQIWKRIVMENIPVALILEDDAVLTPGFSSKIQHIIDTKVPNNWHIILAGCFVCSGEPINEYVSEVLSFGGTHAYIISIKGAHYVLNNAPKVKYHIDIQLSLIPGLRIYKCTNLLAFQADMNTSDVAESKSFPGLINLGLGAVKTSDGISYAYFMNSPLFRLGSYRYHVVFNAWMIVLLGLGFSNLISWQYMAIFVILDTILFPPNSLIDTFAKVSVFGVGNALRRI